jgi:hypothetical protein
MSRFFVRNHIAEDTTQEEIVELKKCSEYVTNLMRRGRLWGLFIKGRKVSQKTRHGLWGG